MNITVRRYFSHTHLFSAVDTLQVERGDIRAEECLPSVLPVALQDLTLQVATHGSAFVAPVNDRRERKNEPPSAPSSIIVTFLGL